MTLGELAAVARAHPAPPKDSVRRQGRREGYPRCCVEFYAALIPFVWCWAQMKPDADAPEVEAYWRLVQAHPDRRGYVPCPPCLGLPLETGLDPAPIITERRRWRADMADALCGSRRRARAARRPAGRRAARSLPAPTPAASGESTVTPPRRSVTIEIRAALLARAEAEARRRRLAVPAYLAEVVESALGDLEHVAQLLADARRPWRPAGRLVRLPTPPRPRPPSPPGAA